MNRILDYNPDPEADVVGRVLLVVHRAIDENFPMAKDPSRSFTKTLFSDNAEETKIERPHLPSHPEERLSEGPRKDKAQAKRAVTKESVKGLHSQLPRSNASNFKELEYSQVAAMSGVKRGKSSAKYFGYFIFILVVLFAAYLWLSSGDV